LVNNNLKANRIFSSIEDLPFPTVTAINGQALGGGFEMCLSTDFRVMAQKAKVGLPEVKLGIFPGFGGTVRLTRLIGADNAIEWICMGSEHRADKALKFNAVDAVVGNDQLVDAAIDMLKGSQRRQAGLQGAPRGKDRQAQAQLHGKHDGVRDLQRAMWPASPDPTIPRRLKP